MLLFAESFDGPNPPVNGTPDKWAAVSSVTVSTLYGRNSTKGAKIADFSTDALLLTPVLASSVVRIGWWQYINTVSQSFFGNAEQLRVRSTDVSSGSLNLRFVNVTGERIEVLNGTGSLGSTANNVLQRLTWQYIEVEVDTGGTSDGTITIYVDGVQVLALTGLFGSHSLWKPDLIGFGAAQGFETWVEDITVYDDQGTTYTSFPVGPTFIKSRLPNGNGNRSELVGSDADSTDNYLQVDENPFSDADYNEGSAADADLYAHENADSGDTILGVMQFFRAQNPAGGAQNMRGLCRSNATEYQGTDQALSSSFFCYGQEWAVDPDTGVAWTESGFNAAEFGVEVRA